MATYTTREAWECISIPRVDQRIIVNCVKCDFHPSKQQRRVRTLSLCDQRLSWHCLKYICKRAASGRWVPALDVEIWATNWSNDCHSLGRQFRDPATTTSTVVQLARLWWLPRQAKPPLHNGWRRTRTKCRWPWNVKSTIRKAKPHKHNTKLDCIRNTVRYLQLYSFPFLHCTIFT